MFKLGTPVWTVYVPEEGKVIAVLADIGPLSELGGVAPEATIDIV
jgi:hypothetical protein